MPDPLRNTFLPAVFGHWWLTDNVFGKTDCWQYFRLITYFWSWLLGGCPRRWRKVPRGVLAGVGALINNSPNCHNCSHWTSSNINKGNWNKYGTRIYLPAILRIFTTFQKVCKSVKVVKVTKSCEGFLLWTLGYFCFNTCILRKYRCSLNLTLASC